MIVKTVTGQLSVGKYTLLSFDSLPLEELRDYVVIDWVTYKIEIVFDLPNNIAIIGHGDFIGKEVILADKDEL